MIVRIFLTLLTLATSLPGDAARHLAHGLPLATPTVVVLLRAPMCPVLRVCTARTTTATIRLQQHHHRSLTSHASRRRLASACRTHRLRKNWRLKRRTVSLLARNSSSMATLAPRLYALRLAQGTPRQPSRLSVLRLLRRLRRLLHPERTQCVKSNDVVVHLHSAISWRSTQTLLPSTPTSLTTHLPHALVAQYPAARMISSNRSSSPNRACHSGEGEQRICPYPRSHRSTIKTNTHEQQ
jgi:hypothetical protein